VIRPRYDAVVIGARVAGASTAMLLARAGLDVLVVDRAQEGADTLSTHALMRGGVMQLARWGVLDAVAAAGTPMISETVFHYGEDTHPVAIRPDGFAAGLYAPRRTVLDGALVAAARRAGAEVRHRVGLADLTADRHGRVTGAVLTVDGLPVEVKADLVIGADGSTSAVAAAAGAAEPYRTGSNGGTAGVYAYVAGLDPHVYHWHFVPEAAASVIPTNDGLACVGVSVRPDRFRREVRADVPGAWHRLLRQVSPALADAVAPAAVGRHRSFPGRRAHFRRSAGQGWALVGDAGHYDDPATAHGITAALRDAELLARAVTAGGLASYQAARDELSDDIFEVTDRIASFDWDLDALALHHRDLSRAMRAETEAIAAWPARTEAAA